MSNSTLENTTIDEKKNLPKYEEKGFEDKENIINQIFDKYGYGIRTINHMILTCLFILTEGLEFTVFTSLLIPFKQLYSLTDNMISIISSLIFIGVGLGSFYTTVISNKFSRTSTIKFLIVVLTICHICIWVFENLLIFVVLRFFIGFSLGVIVPISLNILAEYLPLNFRGLSLTLVWIPWNLGQISLLYLALLIMPNFETFKLPQILLFSCIIPVFTMIYTLIFLEDSPTNLILKNKNEEAFAILKKYTTKTEFTKQLKERMVREVRGGVNSEFQNSITNLFSKKMIRITILLSVIWFIFSFTGYGLGIILPLTLQKLGVEKAAPTNNMDNIVSQIQISLLSIPGSLVAGFMLEIPYFGRILSQIILCISGFILMVLTISVPNQFAFFLGLCNSAMGAAFTINGTYSTEVYPTKIRDIAMGFLFFCTRCGGFLSQWSYIRMHQINQWLPYSFSLLLYLIALVSTILLPIETQGKRLDFDISDHHNELSEQEDEKLKLKKEKKDWC
jgi:MFS family permease